MPPPRYQLAQVPCRPPHKSGPQSLPRLLAILREQFLFRWRPFFVFQEGEDAARAIWCPVCGRLTWSTTHVREWRCGFCRTRFLG